jgi:hypothetical protein
LGYRKISVGTGFVDIARKIISSIDIRSLQEMVKDIEKIGTAAEVRLFIRRFVQSKLREGNGTSPWPGLKEIESILFRKTAI